MDGFVAGEVSLVTEGGLAAITLVWLVAVDLKRVPFQSVILRELRVTFITEESTVFCKRTKSDNVKNISVVVPFVTLFIFTDSPPFFVPHLFQSPILLSIHRNAPFARRPRRIQETLAVFPSLTVALRRV